MPNALLVKNTGTLIFSPFSGDTRFLCETWGGGGARGQPSPQDCRDRPPWHRRAAASRQMSTMASSSLPSSCPSQAPNMPSEHEPHGGGAPLEYNCDCKYFNQYPGGLWTVRLPLLCANALLSWFQSCKETMDHLKAERVALNCYHNFVIVHSDEEVCQWMREQQGLPPWRVGNYFVSSLLDPSILVLITLLQQVFTQEPRPVPQPDTPPHAISRRATVKPCSVRVTRLETVSTPGQC